MNTKQLRQKILDLAIRGKLVPQDPNDEPASVLLERIKAEKERLIKEGKIKRPKKSATTADKPHYPFEIPSNWVWCNLNNVAQVFGRIGFRGYTKNDLMTSAISKFVISNHVIVLLYTKTFSLLWFLKNSYFSLIFSFSIFNC